MTRAPSALNMVLGPLLLVTMFALSARGIPVNRRQSELDSAVDGVQKYLESSGFPKMTRGEVMEFLNDFSRNSRVSRSDNTGKERSIAPTETRKTVSDGKQTARPKFPEGESPLNYGYPMSALGVVSSSTTTSTTTTTTTATDPTTTTTQMTFVTVPPVKAAQPQWKKKTVGPSVDVTAYSKFKKIPEARNVKIDDEMTEFLGGFGLLDAPSSKRGSGSVDAARRRDDGLTETTADELLLRSLLAETGTSTNGTAQASTPVLDAGGVRRSTTAGRGHVFNPSDSDLKTVDVNRIAKIVENIRLLADGNDTASLSQDAIRTKLENITADIATIDRPVASTVSASDQSFDGYQVFFDDDTKQAEPDDLPVTPNAAAAASLATVTLDSTGSPPDPLSTDELQQLVEKNKNDVKRQQPAATTTAAMANEQPATTTVTDDPVAASTSSEAVRAQSFTDSSEAVATGMSTAAGARDVSTTEASPSLSQLAESFGGGETASSDPPTAFETEAPRMDRPRNGLYFYVDWNSFLTVNEGQKTQVNLRFAPKAGNPAHFLKVTVP
uniref:Uncharacterized protein n=1 Tax=Sipha flava TaxID=143950 RepID=A0A2S2QQ71_9HEMI